MFDGVHVVVHGQGAHKDTENVCVLSFFDEVVATSQLPVYLGTLKGDFCIFSWEQQERREQHHNKRGDGGEDGQGKERKKERDKQASRIYKTNKLKRTKGTRKGERK